MRNGAALLSRLIGIVVVSGCTLSTPNLPKGGNGATGSSTGTPSGAVVAVSPQAQNVPTGLAYSSASATYVAGAAIPANVPTFSGAAPSSFSVSPALPAGLTLNASTGVISGTPSAPQAAMTYTVTASNGVGSVDASLTIAVSATEMAPGGLTYSINPANFGVGQAIPSETPSLGSGSQPVTYSVNPPLPTGLSLNPSTGVISGTPTAIASAGSFTITATNGAGMTSATLSIAVSSASTPAINYPTYSLASGIFTTGAAVDLAPTNTGGAASSWSITPALPPGIGVAFNPATGLISGTVSGTAVAAAYVVTATNASGSSSATLVLGFSNPANANFATVNTILSSNGTATCINCHYSGGTSPDLTGASNYAGLSAVVTPKAPLSSPLFVYVLPSSVGLPGSGMMPQTGNHLNSTQLQSIQDWIAAGANVAASGGATSAVAAQLISSPTQDAVTSRLLMALGPAGLTVTSRNFSAELNTLNGGLPSVPDPTAASGFDKIPMLIYAACSDLTAANIQKVYGVSTSQSIASQSTALANAGVTMVNNLIGGIATNSDVVATQGTNGVPTTQAIFQTLVTNEQSAGDSTAAAFVAVCMAANTFGVEMVGY